MTARDVKGLYARARRGELSNLIGVSSGNPYEPPVSADLVLETSRESPEESAAKLHDYLNRCLEPGVRG